MSTITVSRNPHPLGDADVAAALATPRFGEVFTDHMALAHWSAELGWHEISVVPYAPLPMDPATSVLHYGQAIFEGLKAYRLPGGDVATFRPEANAARFTRSAERMAMTPIPEELFIDLVDELVRIDRRWVPGGDGQALYLRPFMYASEVGLGAHPANRFTFLVIASPVGNYFGGEVHPVAVKLVEDYVRAAPGGTGAAKFAGNYAAGFAPQAAAEADGFDQVLFLDAIERRYIEELGGMNAFFVFEGNRLVTPELSGTILAGITRDSILTLAADAGYQVEQRRVALDEIEQAATDGTLAEAFACGTAAVVTPIGQLATGRGRFTVGDGAAGTVTMSLRETLTGIQLGTLPDTHDWVHPIKP